jgi:hypothetical protein
MNTHDWAQQEATIDSEIGYIFSIIDMIYSFSPFNTLNIVEHKTLYKGYTFTIDGINFYVCDSTIVCGDKNMLYTLTLEEMKQVSEYLRKYKLPDSDEVNPYHYKIMDINAQEIEWHTQWTSNPY